MSTGRQAPRPGQRFRRLIPILGVRSNRLLVGAGRLLLRHLLNYDVAEPLFGILQRKAGDASDSGLQFPIFTDTAIKPGLAPSPRQSVATSVT